MGDGAGVHRRTAIIDIGSNSVRLVVYDGPARLPAILFNEKVLAGLGAELGAKGAIGATAMARALHAMRRFRRLCDALEPDEVIAVATAAVRDASNGAVLIEEAARIGLSVEVLSGDREAEAAALGVISGMPEADGIVGDLGGGSLELTRVQGGEVGERLSLPLGVLRLAMPAERIAAAFSKGVAGAGWLKAARGRPFYLVGGSWRSLARLSIHLREGTQLPILHAYRMEPEEAARLAWTVAGMDKAAIKAVPEISGGRAETLLGAAQLLQAVVDRLQPSALVVSAYGLREGLLYGRLDAGTRAQDPLLAAARDEARASGRFPEHGDLIDAWIAPLFAGDGAAERRLRHAACLLADTGWRANPEFRATRACEVALHGNWVGIDGRGRAMVAEALRVALDGAPAEAIRGLASDADLKTAERWGLALRLAQRLSAGVAQPLEATRLSISGHRLLLSTAESAADLYSETVERRHRRLAGALGLEPEVSRSGRA